MTRSITRLAIGTVVAISLITAAPAAASPATVTAAPILVAGAGPVTSNTGSADFAIVSYQTLSGPVHTEMSICTSTTSCTHYNGDGGSLSVSVFDIAHLVTTLPGLGPVNLSFVAHAGNTRSYLCQANTAAFTVQGIDVQPSYTAGTAGPWSSNADACGVWATQAAIQYVAL